MLYICILSRRTLNMRCMQYIGPHTVLYTSEVKYSDYAELAIKLSKEHSSIRNQMYPDHQRLGSSELRRYQEFATKSETELRHALATSARTPTCTEDFRPQYTACFATLANRPATWGPPGRNDEIETVETVEQKRWFDGGWACYFMLVGNYTKADQVARCKKPTVCPETSLASRFDSRRAIACVRCLALCIKYSRVANRNHYSRSLLLQVDADGWTPLLHAIKSTVYWSHAHHVVKGLIPLTGEYYIRAKTTGGQPTHWQALNLCANGSDRTYRRAELCEHLSEHRAGARAPLQLRVK